MALTVILALVFVAQGRPAGPVPAAPPTATVRPAKDRYVQGEPIGVVLTIRNPGTAPIAFRFSYPFTFAREFHLIRFDGGRAMPPRADRLLILSGPISAFATTVPAGGEWSATVFLQNYLHSPQPGEFRVGYRFRAPYRVGEPETGEDDPFSDREYPSLSTEGAMTIRVGGPDPAALGRILEGHVEPIVHPGRRRGPGNSADEAIGALETVDGPVVIPYVRAALEAIGQRDDFFLGLDRLFAILERYAGDRDARLAVVTLLRAENGGVSSRALGWLADAAVPVDPGVLVDLFDRAHDRMGGAHSELRYLQRVEVRPTPALRGRVTRCLGGEWLDIDAYALRILARWGVPEDGNVRISLALLAESAKRKRSPDLPLFIDALAAWKYPLGADALRDLLARERKEPIPAYESVLDYIASVRAKEYRGLGPGIVPLLTDARDDVVIAAIRALEALDHPLPPQEVAVLMKRGPGVRQALSRYLRNHPVD